MKKRRRITTATTTTTTMKTIKSMTSFNRWTLHLEMISSIWTRRRISELCSSSWISFWFCFLWIIIMIFGFVCFPSKLLAASVFSWLPEIFNDNKETGILYGILGNRFISLFLFLLSFSFLFFFFQFGFVGFGSRFLAFFVILGYGRIHCHGGSREEHLWNSLA